MERSTRSWIVVSVASVAAIVTLAVLKRGNPVEHGPLSRPTAEARLAPSKSAVEIAETASSSFSCGGQRLDIVTNGSVEPVCMGALVTKHNGSVRSHQIATLTAPRRWLRVEAAGGTILSAAWGSDLRPDFQCQAAECKGISISRRDARGARVMTFERTSLMQASSGGMQSIQQSVQLSGRFDIPAEQLSELACADQGVSIVTSDSSSQTFCPHGGAGFEMNDDGTRRYRFTSLDGESILVATDRNQQVSQVQYEGEVSLACRSAECANVRISAIGTEGAQRFTFSGTTLIETQSGQSNAVLNGSLVLPPL
jgi:hypothetical protein